MDKEAKAIEVVRQFGVQHPNIPVALKQRHEVYVLVLGYDFSNLDNDEQARGREAVNTLMYALRGIGLPIHLELGHV